MKKFVYIFCIAILGAACSKEDVNKTEIVKTIDIPENMVKLSITVPREPETRATMVSRQLSFAADDQIAVIGTLNAETSVVTLDVESISPLSITFSAAIDENMEIGDYAYFPASIVNKDNPTQINWPSSFDGTKAQMPMMAKIDVSKNEANFHYLGAMLKVNLASAPAGVNTLEFKTTNNFVGSYNVTFDGDNNISNVVASSVSGNTETLSVNSTGTYYVPIPAGTYSEFQLAMKQGSYYHKQRTSDLDAAINPVRGNIVNLGDFAYDVDQIEEWCFMGIMNEWNRSNKELRATKIDEDSYRYSRYADYNGTDGRWYYFYNGGLDKQYGVASATEGTMVENKTCKRDHDEIFTATITKSGENLILGDTYYTGDWFGCFKQGEHRVSFMSDLNSWEGIDMIKPTPKAGWDNQYNNAMIWHCDIVVPDNSIHKFKVLAYNTDTSADVWYGKGTDENYTTIIDSKPYGTADWSGGADFRLRLTPGTYTFYFNIRELDLMFVKQ